MLSNIWADQAYRWLLGLAALIVIAGLLGLTLGSGCDNLTELYQAGRWYLHRQLGALLIGLLALTAVSGITLLVVTVRASAAFTRDIASGRVPAREVGAVSKSDLERETRRMLAPVVNVSRPRVERVVDALLGVPVDLGAGGLLIEPDPGGARVSIQMAMERFEACKLPSALHDAVVERLRLMAGIDGEEGSGRLDLRFGDSVEQIRVTISPAVGGRKTRIQILSRAGFALTIDEIDLPSSTLAPVISALDATRGMVLIGGPPRSGLTTTLYAAAHYIDKKRQQPGSIASLERHVQRELPFVHQTEVGGGQSARVLESLLQMKHSVLLIGRLEDPECIRLAFEAAAERLVIACFRSSSAIDAIARVASIVGGQTVSSTLRLVLCQRLVRRLCRGCRTVRILSARERQQLSQLGISLGEAESFYTGRGCQHCNEQGFAGKLPIYEMVTASPDLHHLLTTNADSARWRALLEEGDNVALLPSGVNQARAGRTTIAEVIRAVTVVGQRGAG